MSKRQLFLLFLLAVSLVSCTPGVLDLSGEWRFAMDPADEGVGAEWFNTTLSDTVTLPGTMLTNGKGNPVDINTPWVGGINDRSFFNDDSYAAYRKADNFKIPMWLQPDLYYKGAAWYQREIDIPAGWKGKELSLFFERCHWQTSVWIDGSYAGSADALGAPQTFDLTALAVPGHHTLTVRVDNAIHDIDPGENSHSISDHTQGNWNGIVGAMYIQAKPVVNVVHVDVYPCVADNSFSIKAKVNSSSVCQTRLQLKIAGESFSLPCKLEAGENEVEGRFALKKKVTPWDEFNPFLYELKYRLACSNDSGSVRFGFREIDTKDGRLILNGHPLFLRGTLHCGTFPLTGYPATDKEEWLRELRVCKDFGLNHIRFHSWCPPEAAFAAADELGIYFQIECSAWVNDTSTLGDGKPVDEYVKEEARRIIDAFGNHPSFCLLAYGNEPAGNYVPYLTDFVSHWKAADARRIYTSAGGWPNLPVSDFLCDPKPRIQGWGQGRNSILNADAPSTSYDWKEYTSRYDQPIVSHEIGQWCVYPNFDEIAKYTGPYKARNFEIFRDRLEENGMGDLAGDFLSASGKLQTLCYKADIEAALRTPGFGGFQLLGINDFSGQGTALVGALDTFWDEKGYATGDEYKRFCSELVPLARMEKLIYLSDEKLHADIEIANFSKEIKDATVSWRLSDASGKILKDATLPSCDLPLGNCIAAGSVDEALSGITAPSRLNLEVTVEGHSNDWNIWVYPSETRAPSGEVLLTDNLAEAETCVRKGGKVILSYRQGTLPDEWGGSVKVGFSSIFWNTAWTHGQAPHTLGILCDPSHKALASFPTESYSDYQWQDAMSHAQSVRMDRFPVPLTPVVRIIDDWFTARPLCLIGEAEGYGPGRMLVTGVDFFDDMENRPAARQLLSSLVFYMESL